MSEENQERLLGAILADVVGEHELGLIDCAVRAGLRAEHLGPTGGRIWRAIKQLHRQRPYGVKDVVICDRLRDFK